MGDGGCARGAWAASPGREKPEGPGDASWRVATENRANEDPELGIDAAIKEQSAEISGAVHVGEALRKDERSRSARRELREDSGSAPRHAINEFVRCSARPDQVDTAVLSRPEDDVVPFEGVER